MAPSSSSLWEDVVPLEDRVLSDEHRAVLEQGSLILPDVIKQRGYYTLTKAQVTKLIHLEVIAPVTIRAESWMGIPIVRPDGVTHGEVIRTFGGESAFKYVWPTGLRLALDVHPMNLEALYDTSIEAVITEGIKKADALLSAALREGRRLLVIAANGCDGWKSKIEGSSVASPDLLDIPWQDRKTYVVSDSDYRTNNSVSRGWNDCATYVSGKTGEHRTYVIVVPSAGTVKQGADDFLVAGHALEDLLGLAQSPERALLDTSGQRIPIKLKHGIRLVRDAGNQIPHLVAPLIPERSITLVAGHSGTYKTWHMLGLALDGAFGLPWLGHPGLAPEHGPFTSLYVNKEMSGLILGQRLKTLMQNSRFTVVPNWEQIIEDRLVFTEEADLDLHAQEQRDRLEDAIVLTGAKMVILDSLSMCWHGDENSASEVGDLYARLRGIIERTGCCFVLLHHLLKPPGGKLPKNRVLTQFSIRGSGQLYQQADACVLIDLYTSSSSLQAEDEKLVVMNHAKARTSVEMPAWVTKFSTHDGMFTSMQYLCKLVDAKAQAYTEDPSMTKLQEWILESCRTMPAMLPGVGAPGFRTRQLHLALQQSWSVPGKLPPSDATLHRQISDLVSQGKIVLVEENKRLGNLYLLAEPDEPEMTPESTPTGATSSSDPESSEEGGAVDPGSSRVVPSV